jgi:hypothetical protein
MVVVCLALWSLWSKPARADDLADEADLQFALGTERYEAGAFKEALEHFLASNRLVPNRNVLFNIARTYEQLRRAPDAYRYYVQALEGETNATIRKRTEAAMARITPQVAILKITSQPPGATIYLDRRDLGPRGNAPRTLGLPGGTYRVIAELPGHKPGETGPIDIKIGEEKNIELRLVPILGTLDVEAEAGADVRLDSDSSPVICVTPCSVPVVPGRHTVIVSKSGFGVSESTIDSCTIKRRVVVHRCPAVPTAPNTIAGIASERSAVSSTMIALLPPSSSSERPMRCATRSPTWRPTAVEPVNDTSGMRWSSTNFDAISVPASLKR